jgi:hypothetical protein
MGKEEEKSGEINKVCGENNSVHKQKHDNGESSGKKNG